MKTDLDVRVMAFGTEATRDAVAILSKLGLNWLFRWDR